MHEAKRVVNLVIVVGVETDLIYVEGFGAVDVGSPSSSFQSMIVFLFREGSPAVTVRALEKKI